MPTTTTHSSDPQHKPEPQPKQQFARCLESNTVATLAPFHWMALAIKDFKDAPLISLIFGLVFTLIPAAILYWTLTAETHLVILPATVAFALVGPVFAVGLYDIAWELEKGHKPSIRHSLHSLVRNPVGEWGFAVILTLMMIAWLRLATLIHAIYPSIGTPSLAEMAGFLAVGTTVGAILMACVFAVSAFTPQICLERKVDIMTAIFTSVNAVRRNIPAMIVWAGIIVTCVLLGFLTGAIGFIVIMPILSFASWHAYIAVIKTKSKRHYE